ncbi:MAG: hypothetical protein M1522_02625 [Actinobacteria bacterium]|jgi:hypothetical protein|nr:hypothetical protein [Actinomycetota bacterium]
MAELADRLGVSVSSVSSLEMDDERGAAKTGTINRALVALDLARWDVVVPAAELEAMFTEAEETASEVAWQMALEAQPISDETVSRITRQLVAEAVAAAL